MNAINRITAEDLQAFGESGTASEYQRIATKSAIYPGKGTIFGLSYCAHKLAGEAGEFNEHFGKAMRDDGIFDAHVGFHGHDYTTGEFVSYHVRVMPLTEHRRAYLIKEIGDCLWYLSALCNELGISMFHAMMTNLSKLKDRTDGGTLQGSGDNR